MKYLYIIRHAKSDWDNQLQDFDRPLNQRGKNDAPKMGKHLKENFDFPDLMISSSANRAISTARLIANELEYSLDKIIENKNLYHASPQSILKVLWEVAPEVETIFLFGHNPGLSDLVSYLTDEPTELKTCCVAKLDFEMDDWNGLVAGTCILKTYISPREI